MDIHSETIVGLQEEEMWEQIKQFRKTKFGKLCSVGRKNEL